eukprot:s1591_g6.t1
MGEGKEPLRDERAWMRGWVRTACCGQQVQGSGMSELGCADGCGRRGCKGVGGNGWGKGVAGDERAWMRGRLRTAMGGKKEPLGMSELGCAEGCGRRGCKGVGENGWGEGAARDERAWLTNGRGRRGCKGVGGNGWGEGAARDERAWMGMQGSWVEISGGEGATGDERAWMCEGSGWKWVGRRSRWEERAWMCGRLRTAWAQGSAWKLNGWGEGAAVDERAWMRGRRREWMLWVGKRSRCE